MNNRRKHNHGQSPVAIIGISCLYPDAPGLKAYWQLLFQKKDAVQDVPETHWSTEAYFDPDPKKPDHVYCRRGAFLPAIEFDPSEFGIPPASLEATDTAQILALITARNALQDAGYHLAAKEFDRDRTSVILGVTGTQELVIPLGARLGHPIWRNALKENGVPDETAEAVVQNISESYVPWQENSFPGLLGNVVAGRICNRLDLGGTNCVVDAACASSLSAIHLSILELQTRRSDMVVTGGVDAINDIFMHMCFAKTMILSPSGDIRPFSKHADGTVLGEGVGIVVLKRLEDAERDGDRIYAVIKGIGASSDGKSQSIYAPRTGGQAKALRSAYENAAVKPESVGLIEAHGTGTRVGDKVELSALKHVFGYDRNRSRYCALGSVKSMIGHTKAAAGSAGLIKAALALQHKVLPPTLKAEKPDPDLKLNESAFYLSSSVRPWFADGRAPRRSGVSSFGFGGSNFHVVLEEYCPQKTVVAWDGSVEIFALSGTDRDDVFKQVSELDRVLRTKPPVQQLAYLAQQSRDRFRPDHACRLLLVHEGAGAQVESQALLEQKTQDAMRQLKQPQDDGSWQRPDTYWGQGRAAAPIAFLFPGQGSQYVAMGRDLVCLFPEAMNLLARVNRAGSREKRLTDLIYPIPPEDDQSAQKQKMALRRTEAAQPAIGAVSLAVTRILARFGVKPSMTCGHSFGELTALCAAGWLDADTFFHLAASRGEAMAAAGQKSGYGSMLAVQAPLDRLRALARGRTDLILANLNSPEQGVLSGTCEAIEEAKAQLRAAGYHTTKLPVSAAFHSPLVQDAEIAFRSALNRSEITPSEIPVLANATGDVYPSNAASVRSILAGQIVNPVDFTANIEALYKAGVRTFVEVGPKTVLTGLVRAILKHREHETIATDASAGRGFGMTDLARALARLASLGYPVDLTAWEEPASPPETKRMQVTVTGANFRTANNRHNRKTDANSMKTKPKDNSASGVQREALRALQEGLKSIQAIQAQTTEAHKTFLNAQKEAGRSLQRVMQNIRQLSGTGIGSDRPASDAAQPESRVDPYSRNQSAPLPEEPGQPANPLQAFAVDPDAHLQTETPDSSDHQPGPHSEPAAVPVVSNSPPPNTNIQNTLLAIVSELTGYPQEMLAMEMDLEADLGIDSIKRVEILSALEERQPELPRISPEVLGSLKTLAQIAEAFDEAAQPASTPPADPIRTPDDVDLKTDTIADDRPPIQPLLIDIVSELTGYPTEMLALDMDIEADLGIDSIKRVEILSTLEERLPGLPAMTPDTMGSLKTLGQICDYLTSAPVSGEAPKSRGKRNAREQSPPLPVPTDTQPETAAPPSTSVQRQRVELEKQTIAPSGLQPIPSDRRLLIIGPTGEIVPALKQRLREHNMRVETVQNDEMQTLIDEARDFADLAGIIFVADWVDPGGPAGDAYLKTVFRLTQRVGPHLVRNARTGSALFATLSWIDGGFGFKGGYQNHPLSGGLAGLTKTAALEWRGVTCRALDIDPTWTDTGALVERVMATLFGDLHFDDIEIGLDRRDTYTLSTAPAAYATHVVNEIDLEPNDVVIVTGGARGITAAATRALVEQVPVSLVLLGRSPQPEPDPEWLAGLERENDVKKAILRHQFNNNGASPKDIERAYQGHMANREARHTIRRLESLGASVRYASCDIRDADAVTRLLAEVRQSGAPIRAVVHGAGVIEDRFIVDKSHAQFDRVYDTKVAGFRSLLAALSRDALRYIVVFSSVAARFGNKGQVDYAMANEVLNKFCRQEAFQRKNCRVVAVNWGPWDGGMVSSALGRAFQKNGIELIPVDAGARCMLLEMSQPGPHPVEIVVGAPLADSDGTRPASPEPAVRGDGDISAPMSLTFKREIDTTNHPILDAHVLDGKPVVPLALMTEWFGHGALHDNPGLMLHGIDDMRVLNGIKLDDHKKMIRLFAGKADRRGPVFEVDVELRDGIRDGQDVIHSRAKAILTDALPEPPLFASNLPTPARAYHRTVSEVYDKILFHGSALRGIKAITNFSSQGIAARISSAPAPHKWIQEPLRSAWISDPLALDCAFQLATLWCYEETGSVSLPSYCKHYRQYRPSFPTAGLSAVLQISDVTDRKMMGDCVLVDDENRIVAELRGYEATLDASLYRAFKPHLAPA